MSCDARDFNNIVTRAVILSLLPAREDAEENSDRNIRGICTNVCHYQKLGGSV